MSVQLFVNLEKETASGFVQELVRVEAGNKTNALIYPLRSTNEGPREKSIFLCEVRN